MKCHLHLYSQPFVDADSTHYQTELACSR